MELAREILEEVRALRSELSDYRQETENRLTTVETQIKPLFDNGQPGVLTKLQDGLNDHKAWRWKITGICAGVSGAITAAGWIINFTRK